MKYHFSGFNYDTEQKILKYGSKSIELTKKNHTLLGYLLSRPQQLISREELIDYVWQGRVVTNNTIDQCILKLRKTLNHYHQDDYIESVYGQGVRFLPTINVEKYAPITVQKRNNKMIWMGFSLLVLVVFVSYLLLSEQDYDAIEALNNALASKQNSQADLTTKPLTGVELGTALQQQENPQKAINVLRFNAVHINFVDKNSDRKIFSLGLAKFIEELLYSHFSNYKKLHHSTDSKFDLNVFHSLENINDDLVLTVEFRHADAVLKHEKITAKSEQLLLIDYIAFLNNFPEISGELIKTLLVSEFSNSISLLNQFIYGLGHFEAQENHQAGAILKQINEQDSGFIWAKLYYSLASRRMADLPSSFGRLIQINNSQMSDYLLLIFHRVMAFSYLTVGDYDEARSFFIITKGMATQLHQDVSLALVEVGFSKLALFKFDFSEAKKYLDQAMSYAKKLDNSILLSNMHKNYCSYYMTRSDITEAINHCELALAGYKDLNKPVFYLHVSQNLAELYLQHNDMPQAMKYNESSIKQAKALNHHNGLIRGYGQLLKMALFSGDLEQAEKTLLLMTEKVAEKDHTPSNKSLYLARFWIGAYQSNDSAVVHLETYGRYVSEKNLQVYYPFIKQQIKYYITNQQYEKATQLLEKAMRYQSKDKDPELILFLSQLPNTTIDSNRLRAAAKQAHAKGWFKLEMAFSQIETKQ